MKFQVGNYFIEIDTSTNPTTFKLVNPTLGLYYSDNANDVNFSYEDNVAGIVASQTTVATAQALVDSKRSETAQAIIDLKQKNEIASISNGAALLTESELTDKITQYKAVKQAYEDAKAALALLLEE